MMTDTAAPDPAPRSDRGTRLPWVAPRVQTIVAGEAEEGTRMRNPDGQLTTS